MRLKLKKLWAKVKQHLPLIVTILLVGSMLLGLWWLSLLGEKENTVSAKAETKYLPPVDVSSAPSISSLDILNLCNAAPGYLDNYGLYSRPDGLNVYLGYTADGSMGLTTDNIPCGIPKIVMTIDNDTLYNTLVADPDHYEIFRLDDLSSNLVVGYTYELMFMVRDVDVVGADFTEISGSKFNLSYTYEGDRRVTSTKKMIRKDGIAYFSFSINGYDGADNDDGGQFGISANFAFRSVALCNVQLYRIPTINNISLTPYNNEWYEACAEAYGLNEYYNGYAEGFNNAYEVGYADGIKDLETVEDNAYAIGHSDGYAEGIKNVGVAENNAYNNGYNDGVTDLENAKAQSYAQGHLVGYDEGYSVGYADGKSIGDSGDYDSGYDEGYSVGYDTGHDLGYKEGYNDGHAVLEEDYRTQIENEVLFSKEGFLDGLYSIMDAPMRIIRNSFNFELFGINVSSAVFFVLTLMLVVLVIKKLRGM